MVMSRGASVGLFRTLPFIAGLVIGDLLLFGMALLGLVALAKSFAPLFLFIKWVGVCYLLYLAYSMWNAKPDAGRATPTGGTGWRSFAIALFLPLGNPKAVGFYVALLPAFMDLEELSIVAAVNSLLWFGVSFWLCTRLLLIEVVVTCETPPLKGGLTEALLEQW